MARCSNVRTTTTRYRTVDAPALRPCAGCREPLPAEAKFCTACGLCMLEIVDDDVEELDDLDIEEIDEPPELPGSVIVEPLEEIEIEV